MHSYNKPVFEVYIPSSTNLKLFLIDIFIFQVSMPHTQDSIVTYSILNQCEVASNMARYSGILFGHRCNSTVSTNQLIAESRWEGFGPVVRDRILAGNYFLLRKCV